MGELIPIREFARRVDVSDTAVRKAIATGRVTVARWDEKGERKLPMLDYDVALKQWRERTNQAMQRPEQGVEQGRIRQRSSVNISGSQETEKSIPEYSVSRAEKEFYSAQKIELEVKKTIGEQVEIAKVAEIVERDYSAVRAQMLSIPSRLAQELSLINDANVIRSALQKAIEDALSELSSGVAGFVASA